MAKKIKPTATEKVDEYMKMLKHPMLDVINELRRIIATADLEIEEDIFYNAPCFFYTGEMKPFNPKEYKRYIVGFNLFKKDCIRLIFLTGAKLNDESGILEGDYADGRRLLLFYNLDEVKKKEKALQKLIKNWMAFVEK